MNKKTLVMLAMLGSASVSAQEVSNIEGFLLANIKVAESFNGCNSTTVETPNFRTGTNDAHVVSYNGNGCSYTMMSAGGKVFSCHFNLEQANDLYHEQMNIAQKEHDNFVIDGFYKYEYQNAPVRNKVISSENCTYFN